MFNLLLFLLLAISSTTLARSVHGSKTLVLYDERLTTLSEFSKFFEDLNSRSYELNYFPIKNETESIEIFDKEHRLYDNLIVFPIKGKHLNKLVSVKDLLNFYEDGGDVLAITDPNGVADSIRLFLNELGIYPSLKSYTLYNFMETEMSKFLLSSDNAESSFVYRPTEEKSLIVENSSGALLNNHEQIVPILRAPRFSSTISQNKEPWTVGTQGYIAAGFQNLDNARTSWIGSQNFFKNSHTGNNGDFSQELTKWTFREKSVIKSVGASHKHADGTSYESLPYKIKDDIVFEIGLSQWTGEKWIPFVANDIQFEVRLVDPYHRMTLKEFNKTDTAQFYTSGSFKLPDHYGVFTFITDYKRNGLTFVTEKDVKSIRHLANDEYPRSWEITNAWVYLAAISSVIISWFAFIIFFVSSQPAKATSFEKKNN